MSAKLLLHPLDTERYIAVRMSQRDSGLSQVDTATLIEKFAVGRREDLERGGGGSGGGATSGGGQLATMTLQNGNRVSVPIIEGVNVDKMLPRLQTDVAGDAGRNINASSGGDGGGGGLSRTIVPGSETIPREMHSPDYNRLRVVRVEVDGHMVWEVRPISPDGTGSPI